MSTSSPATPDTFVPAFDTLIRRHGGNLALVYGAMWRFAQMETGTCTASHSTIARRIGKTRQTVNTHIQTLLRLGLIVDLTPDVDGATHTYLVKEFDTGGQNTLPLPVKKPDRTSQIILHKESIKRDFKKSVKRARTLSKPLTVFEVLQNLREEYAGAENLGPD